MNRDRIIAKLRERESELQSSGILHLALFGSAARGDDSDQSDVDLMADFDETKKLSLIGRVRLENQLADILGVKADVADRKMLRPKYSSVSGVSRFLSFNPPAQHYFAVPRRRTIIASKLDPAIAERVLAASCGLPGLAVI